MWDEIIEKAVNAEVKTSLQPLSRTKEIDFRYPKSYKPSVKRDKDKANREYQNGNKTKPHYLSLTNTSQP